MSDSKKDRKNSTINSPEQAQSTIEHESQPKSPIKSNTQSKRLSINTDQAKIQFSAGNPEGERSRRNSNQDDKRLSATPKSNNESPAISGLTSRAKSPATYPPNLEMPESTNASKRSSVDKKGERTYMRQRRLEYFRSGNDADCEVHVPHNAEQQDGKLCYKKFPCHRIFLATASEKLEQDIFQNKQWNGVLQINGVSPESVEIFLEYIYTFEISDSHADLRIIGDIYILSSAYNMPEMLHTFSKQLKDAEWPLEDIIPAYNLAFQHNMVDLESACLAKILEQTEQLKSQPSIMKLQIYAFNYLIQHWKVTEALTTAELIQLVQQYQLENELNFKNTKQFPHFSKICKYFPDVLLDGEGIIYIK